MKYKNPYLIYAIGRALGTKQVASAEFDGRIEVTKYDDNGNIEHVYNSLEDIPNFDEHYIFVENDILSMQIRKKRDFLLLQSDWTQTSEQSEEVKLKWRPYRQALRDISLQNGFPLNVIFPEKPQ